MTSTGRKIMAASLLLHSPVKRRHFPSSIPGNRRLQSRGIEASSTSAIEGTGPPPPRLRPIKGRPALGEYSHTSNAPPLSPQRGPAIALQSRGSTACETPLHRLPNRGNPVIELACLSFPSPAPWLELSGTGAAGGRAPVSSRAWQCVILRSEIAETKLLYMCPGCLIHTYSNNMINIYHIQ
jgi:hypothetical protein